MFLLESLKENVEILYKHTNIKYNKLISDCKFLENIIINEKKKINYNSPQYNFYQCMEINVFNYIEKLKNYPDVEFQQFGEILKDLNLINITKSQEIEDTEKKLINVKLKLQEKEETITSMENTLSILNSLILQKSISLEELDLKIKKIA